MQLKILITTPKGYATKIQRQLRPFLIGIHSHDHQTYTNSDDTQILWIVQCKDARRMMSITRNITLYDRMIHMILDRKDIRKLAKLSKEQEQELNDMLTNHTSVEIVKIDAEQFLGSFVKVDE